MHHLSELPEVTEIVSMYHLSITYDVKLDTLIYNRKLREGPGQSMYGLEVCKSLDLPEDFIERAYAIRNKYNKSKQAGLGQ